MVTTDRLLLDRAFGDLHAEDYITWAVEQLHSGADSPSLRILAGLSAEFDREEVESYFEKACSELGIPWMPMDRTPREVAQVVRALYDNGALSPDEVVRRMSALAAEDFEDELLMPWRFLASDLDTADLHHQGWGFELRFYPIEAIENLRQTVDLEWEIFERLLDESELEQVWDWVRCKNCGAVGEPTHEQRSLAWRLSTKRRSGQPSARWAHCSKCGSAEVVLVGYDPSFRLARLRKPR